MQDIFLVLSTLDKQRTPALSVSPFIKFCATRAIVSYGLGGGKVIKTGGFYGGLRRPRTWLRGLHVLFHLFLRIDPISNWWFHHYAMKIASVKQFSENYNAFSTILQDNFFLISLFVVDQIEDFFTLQQNYLENCY